jgi:hypothetical protein
MKKRKGLSVRAKLIKRAAGLRGRESMKSIFKLSDGGLRKFIRTRRTSFDEIE